METIKQACERWVNGFNAIPESVVEKLNAYDGSIREITPLTIGDRVYSTDPDWMWKEGEIVETKCNGEKDLYAVKLDDEPDDPKIISEDCLTVVRETELPMWGTMWTFDDSIDDEWVNGEYLGPHLQEMADCGFRIYESDDFGIIFGIDGCGYDFYSAHWCPLYKARGLKWHDEEEGENAEST